MLWEKWASEKIEVGVAERDIGHQRKFVVLPDSVDGRNDGNLDIINEVFHEIHRVWDIAVKLEIGVGESSTSSKEAGSLLCTIQ